MIAQVIIKNGKYRGQDVTGRFNLVKPWKDGAKGGFVTVESNGALEHAPKGKAIRISVAENDIEYSGDVSAYTSPQGSKAEEPAPIIEETDEQTTARIEKTFAYIETLAKAAQENKITGLIISGPAGIGKSYGVEKQLNKMNMTAMMRQPGSEKFEIITGGTSGIGLYKKLWENRKPGNVVVFDDCDTALFEELQLNLLKAAMDTRPKRKLCWMKESSALDGADIPNSFTFEGSIIFLSNLKFDNCPMKKLAPHLEAIMSRVHYLDLCLDTPREKLLRVKQVVKAGMLKDHDLNDKLKKEVVQYVYDNVDYLHELSLRTVLKVADLASICSKTWRDTADYTVLSHRGRMQKLAKEAKK